MHKELFDLTGKTALITGASSGLGERFAITLAANGAKVILTARRIALLTKLAEQIKDHGGAALAVEMNVADQNSVKQAMQSIAAEKIDILINNAGIFKNTAIFAEDNNQNFIDLIEINLLGVWYVTKIVANHMRNNNICGSIINIASIYGDNKLNAEAAGYCASKAAVIQLTKALVGELATRNIRINVIAPGYFDTPMSEPTIKENIKKINPLGFLAKPKELDGLILYLASNNASRYVTGSCFTIDGGASWGGYNYSSI